MRSRLLIVEDDADIRTLLGLVFGGDRFEVVFADTAAAAREILARADPLDLVLLDIVLPDSDDLGLCREVKAACPALPVLVLTARPEAEAEARRASAEGFMLKPFDPDELIAAVERLVAARAAG